MSERATYLSVRYQGDDRWLAYIDDGGPISNSEGVYSTDKLVPYLSHFLLEREGAVYIERHQSDLIDAEREAFEARRDALTPDPELALLSEFEAS